MSTPQRMGGARAILPTGTSGEAMGRLLAGLSYQERNGASRLASSRESRPAVIEGKRRINR